MIENFRKLAKTKIMQAILLTLVVAFMLSGLSAGFLSQATDNYIVKVAGEKIYPSQVQEEYRNITRVLAERGMDTDESMLALLGITQQRILNEMINRKLLFAEVDSLGLTVSDDLLRKEITTSPDFQVDGKFNNDTFKRFLYTRGQREHQYLDELRQEISSSVLLGTLFGAIEAPEKVLEIGEKEVSARYDIEIVEIPADFAELDTAATDEELEEYLSVSPQTFERAESRAVSFASVAKLEDARASLELATTIEDEIAGGATLDEIIAKYGTKLMQKTYIEQVPNSPINAMAYTMLEGEIEIIEEGDSYFVVQLDSVKEAYLPELAEIRDEVEKEWVALEKKSLSREQALELFAKAKAEKSFKSVPSKLKRKNFKKLSLPEFLQKGYLAMDGGKPESAAVGEVFGVYETISEGYVLARLKGKSYKKLGALEAEQYQTQASQAYANDLQQSYMNYLAAKHEVEFNEDDTAGTAAQ